MPDDLFLERVLNQAFFKNRYDIAHQAGVDRLMEGNVAIFGGVTEAMKNDLIVAAMSVTGTGTTYLLEDLQALEGLGFSLFLAGRDFPVHVTIQIATGGLEAGAVLAEGCAPSANLSFNRLVLDSGGNIVLMNEGVPREVAEWRGWASQVMTEYGGQPKPLPILHSTLARIIDPKAPSEIASQRLLAFVEDRNERLQSTPVQFAPGHTYVGTVYDLLTS